MKPSDLPAHHTPQEGPTTIHFPQEIIDLFIDTIAAHQSDKDKTWYKSLCACALVSRSFYRTSHKYIFAHLTLESDLYFPSKLAKAIAGHPQIISEIRSLSINFNKSHRQQEVRENVKRLPTKINRLLHKRREPTLENLLIQKTLVYFSFHAMPGQISWDLLGNRAQFIIKRAWSNTSPKHFRIVNLSKMNRLFFLGTVPSSLRELTIYNTYFDFAPPDLTDSDKPSTSPSDPLQLLSVLSTLRLAGSTVRYFFPYKVSLVPPPSPVLVDACQLKHLSLSLYSGSSNPLEFIAIQWVFLCVTNSLEYLEIDGLDPSGPDSDFPFPISLDTLRNLSTCEIISWERRQKPPQKLTSIIKLLATRSKPGIKEVKINANWRIRDFAHGKEVLHSQDNWADLDAILSSLCWGSLNKIEFKLCFYFPSGWDETHLKNEEWIRGSERFCRDVFQGVLQSGAKLEILIHTLRYSP